MRDRLIEILEDDYDFSDFTSQVDYEALADHLLKNGVIVPPCKVDDTVWRIIEMSTGKTLNRNGATVNPTIKRFIKPVKVTKNNLLDICETYGKKVFSTKEEAETKLAEVK